ncbi:uncharacterized protein LOC111263751 isoform X1 [Varroa jacobsoni]|uniref:uncharacterized protein LOC111263751 isoform X1 n=2 Tax=Varroa jacobsoni TaxID=62625 RepID=UPI000BF6A7AD|nr:uncharacterized protein LOC111263751 isoform X1 [Varroa jacobsoni]XP_022694859.1 uncharacterized protein LOC111263751 isoform X1 [Varroa jacobsoni]
MIPTASRIHHSYCRLSKWLPSDVESLRGMFRINETLCESDRPCPFAGSLCDINLKRCICALSHVYNHGSDSCEPTCVGGPCGSGDNGDGGSHGLSGSTRDGASNFPDLGSGGGIGPWPVSAAHIAAMFAACVLILAVCHLVIRLYMRRREAAFLRNHNRSYLESLVVRGAMVSSGGGPEGPVIAGAAPNFNYEDLDAAVACVLRPPGYLEATRTNV